MSDMPLTDKRCEACGGRLRLGEAKCVLCGEIVGRSKEPAMLLQADDLDKLAEDGMTLKELAAELRRKETGAQAAIGSVRTGGDGDCGMHVCTTCLTTFKADAEGCRICGSTPGTEQERALARTLRKVLVEQHDFPPDEIEEHVVAYWSRHGPGIMKKLEGMVGRPALPDMAWAWRGPPEGANTPVCPDCSDVKLREILQSPVPGHDFECGSCKETWSRDEVLWCREKRCAWSDGQTVCDGQLQRMKDSTMLCCIKCSRTIQGPRYVVPRSKGPRATDPVD